MEFNEFKIDTYIKYQVKLVIDNKAFYSEKTFNSKDDSDNYMKFLSENEYYNWYSIPVLCPRENINISDLITGEYQKNNPLANVSFKEAINQEFKK